ncbi:FBP domain-containing protein [Actinomadura sp. KC06]|uniref:FBP domain-containing protein n=1 Tax=Actinomadura sp. KC06 TaxID=2530369 RepID=UPI00104FC232|nr:FBP domain-containing protein [Actinomadura sp. KC06]TDD29167.1 FBP domain-containing protein [Actinomadura sp. KC06]
MRAITERDLRSCFVNCSKGDAKRLTLPKDFAQSPWDDLDFLGWRDPKAPDRAYLVTETGPTGIALRLASAPGKARGFNSTSLCSFCQTVHTGGGVALMSARRSGEAGKQGNTVGRYLCADLACSLYVRGKKQTLLGDGHDDGVPLEEKVARIKAKLNAFVASVVG